MPTAPARLCARCQRPVMGICQDCQRRKCRQTDANRGTSTERGYTTDWRVLRVMAFTRDLWQCRACGWQPTVVSTYQRLGIPELPSPDLVLDELRQRQQASGRHLQGDHILTIADRPDLRLCLDNIQTLCSVCHSRKTAREDGGWSNVNTV